MTLSSYPLLTTALALTLLGPLFKLSVAPFHMWTPDVYEGAPTPVTAILAAAPKIAMFVFLMRLTSGPFEALMPLWQTGLAILAVISMFAGASLAMVQSSLKRLLAYSAIAHVGFMMVGVAAGTPQGHGTTLFYLAVYALTMTALFTFLIATPIRTVEELRGYAKTDPILAAILAMMFFSLAGIPPLAGFMAKFGVFMAAVAAGYAPLAIAAVLASVVACFYPLWLIKIMYFDGPPLLKHEGQPPPIPFILQLNLALAGILTLVLGLFPTLLTTFTHPAALTLF
jgi:NADH-quinone oxidoreductase subunit N